MLTLGLHLNLALKPPLTSVLKKSEKWLEGDSHRMHALERLQDPYRADLYETVLDYVFCELFTWHQDACFAYYDGKGPPLRKLLPKKQIEAHDLVLLNCLKVAYEIYLSDLEFSWSEYRAEMLSSLGLASHAST